MTKEAMLEKALELACEQLEKENDEYMADHQQAA